MRSDKKKAKHSMQRGVERLPLNRNCFKEISSNSSKDRDGTSEERSIERGTNINAGS